jgi:hypothetical protein
MVCMTPAWALVLWGLTPVVLLFGHIHADTSRNPTVRQLAPLLWWGAFLSTVGGVLVLHEVYCPG